MTTKILRLLQLAVYLIITSQALFYLIILSDAMKQVSLENFIEFRKIVDGLMGTRFRVIYYVGLILTLSVVILLLKKPDSVLFITSCIALVCLIIDVSIAMKGNIPINNLINTYTPGDTTQDWSALRTQWLNLINIRGGFVTVGMLSQIAGLLWTSR
jgi:hypothetical protein